VRLLNHTAHRGEHQGSKKSPPRRLMPRATPRRLFPVAQVFNLCPIGAPRGVAHAPSPDACSGHPALRSLDAACAPPSMAPLASNAGSRGTGNPSLIPVSYKPKAVRPRAPHAERGVWWQFAPRLTALGLDRSSCRTSRRP